MHRAVQTVTPTLGCAVTTDTVLDHPPVPQPLVPRDGRLPGETLFDEIHREKIRLMRYGNKHLSKLYHKISSKILQWKPFGLKREVEEDLLPEPELQTAINMSPTFE